MNGHILPPDGTPLELSEMGIVLLAQNLQAEVELLPPADSGMRGPATVLDPAILRDADVSELASLALNDQFPGQGQAQQVTMFAPALPPQRGQLLLYTDENGGMSFHPPQPAGDGGGMRAGASLVRYDIPIRPPIGGDEVAKERGLVGYAGKKLLQVIGWEVAELAARKAGPPLVRAWESRFRPLRLLGWPDLFQTDAAPLEAEEKIPAGERALLFIHGTFSRVATGFAGLAADAPFLAALATRYGNHIYGFDHPTVASGVATNVMQLYDRLGPGMHTVDIVCHSRGGLVARALRDLGPDQLKARFGIDAEIGEYGDELRKWGQKWTPPEDVTVRVERIFFAGTPNNGTILAQPTHLNPYLDILMTATNLLPDFVDIGADAILSTAKLLLNETMPKLPGLNDQRPGSGLLQQLRPQPAARDAAVSANYEPPPGLQAVMRAANLSADLLFNLAANDLVVPTNGVTEWPDGIFAADRCKTFDRGDAVHHCNLFQQDDVRRRLLAWAIA